MLADAVMGVLFFVWAVYQYNDADVLLWMSFYGIAALACLLFVLDRLPLEAATGYGVLSLLGFGYLAVRFVVDGEPWSIQESEVLREALGALVVGLWMSVLAVRLRVRERGVAAP